MALSDGLEVFYNNTLQTLRFPASDADEIVSSIIEPFHVFFGNIVYRSTTADAARNAVKILLRFSTEVSGLEDIYTRYIEIFFEGVSLDEDDELLLPSNLLFSDFYKLTQIEGVTKETSARLYVNTIFNWLKTGGIRTDDETLFFS